MAQTVINVGTNANDGTGDDLRTAMVYINNNFTELYAASPITSTISIEGNKIFATSSNADLVLEASGTGAIVLPAITINDNNFIDNNNVNLTLTTGPSFTISSEGSDEGTLIPGEKAHYIATFDLTQSVVDAGGLSNQATVYASSPGQTNDLDVETDDPETTAIGDATVMQIDHAPVIEVVKIAVVDDVNEDEKTNIGDTIT